MRFFRSKRRLNTFIDLQCSVQSNRVLRPGDFFTLARAVQVDPGWTQILIIGDDIVYIHTKKEDLGEYNISAEEIYPEKEEEVERV